MSSARLLGVGADVDVVVVHPDDPLARPLFAELAVEYDRRYGDLFGGAEQELTRYPVEQFTAPLGAFVLLLEHGVAVAGGAFKPHPDDGTVEVKRMWTAAAHRRRGLARRVLTELQQHAATAGYTRAFLTTGPLQPEARELYLSAGWTPLFHGLRPTAVEELRALPVVDRLYAFETTLG